MRNDNSSDISSATPDLLLIQQNCLNLSELLPITVLMYSCTVFTHGRIRLRNDLYCVEWGVKLYSLTHSLMGGVVSRTMETAILTSAISETAGY